MTHIPVTSSNIASVAYDNATKKMQVKFASGATYEYEGVPPEVHTAMMFADSPGRQFAHSVKMQFKGARIS
jgi:KTSC domain